MKVKLIKWLESRCEKLEAENHRMKEYFKKEGEITCHTCLHGPFTKPKPECEGCEDFEKWTPEK